MNRVASTRPVPRRDPRVTRAVARMVALPSPRPIGCAAAEFVQSVLRRHVGRRSAVKPLDRTFRSLPPPALFVHTEQRHAYRFALGFTVRLQRLLRERAVPRPFLAWRPAGAASAPAGPAAALAKPAFIERILARERRVESATTIREVVERVISERPRTGSRPAASPAPSPAKPAPAVPMVVRRPAAPQPVVEDQTRPPSGRTGTDEYPGAPTRLRAAVPAAPIPLSPSELSRLTDQVVTAIDRRFVAHRERRGRI